MRTKHTRGIRSIDLSWVIIGLVAVVTLAGGIYSSFPRTNTSSANSKLTDWSFHERTREAVRRYSQGHPDAEELYQFLMQRGVNANSFHRGSMDSWDGPKVGLDKFYLVVNHYPIRTGDGYGSFGCGKGVDDEPNSLSIFDHPTTDQWLALVMFHELKHARDHILKITTNTSCVRSPNNFAWIDDEIETHDFELLIADRISENRLVPLMKEIIREQKFAYPVLKMNLDKTLYQRMGELFDKEKSALEKDGRDALFDHGINKLILEQTQLSEEEKRSARRTWYLAYYRANGYVFQA